MLKSQKPQKQCQRLKQGFEDTHISEYEDDKKKKTGEAKCDTLSHSRRF